MRNLLDADFATSSVWSHGFAVLTKRKLLGSKVTSMDATSSIVTLSTTDNDPFCSVSEILLL